MKCVYTGRFEGAARHAFWCEDFCALERVSLRNRSVSMEIAFCEFRLLIVCIRPCRHYGAGDKSPKAARFGVGATTLKQFPAYLNRWDSQQARNEGVFAH
jgi:hypothetical protein